MVPFSRPEFAFSDAAKGIAAAVERVATARHGGADAASEPTREHGLDVFHTKREARRVLACHWRHAEAAWDAAEAADARVTRARQQGLEARGPAGPARAAWRKAAVALKRVEDLEGVWRRAQAALELFRPDGRFNDHAIAEAEIAAALPGLPGADEVKVLNFLRDDRSLAFLDRMHRLLESAEPRSDWREAMAWRWWLRHRRSTASDPVKTLVQPNETVPGSDGGAGPLPVAPTEPDRCDTPRTDVFRQVNLLRRQFLQQADFPFADVLSSAGLAEALREIPSR